MIVVFHGTKLGKHGAAAAMVAIGAMEAFRANKKVLLMSFCGNDPKNNIENLANRQVEVDEATQSTIAALGGIEYDDSGIDALVRRAETGKLMTEHFDNAVSPMIRTKNGLDICNTTKDEGFEENIADHFEIANSILSKADSIYNYVFVLSDPDNVKLTQQLDRRADKVVCVVRQGRVDKTLPFLFEPTGLDKLDKRGNNMEDKPGLGRKKLIYLVADYEEESAYNTHVIRKQYGNAAVCIIPHNVKYRDASSDGVLVRFASRNAKIMKNPGDYNYAFCKAINKLLDCIAGFDELKRFEDEKEKPEANLEDAEVKELKKQDKAEKNLASISPEQVNVQEEQEKQKGLFGKYKNYRTATINTQEEPDDEMPEQEPEMEQEPEEEPEQEPEKKPKKAKKFSFFGKKAAKKEEESDDEEDIEEDDLEDEDEYDDDDFDDDEYEDDDDDLDDDEYEDDDDLDDDEEDDEEYDDEDDYDEEEEEPEEEPEPVVKKPARHTAASRKTKPAPVKPAPVKPASRKAPAQKTPARKAAAAHASAASRSKTAKSTPTKTPAKSAPKTSAKPAAKNTPGNNKTSSKMLEKQVKRVVAMREKGIPDDLIAQALDISEDKVEQLATIYELMH